MGSQTKRMAAATAGPANSQGDWPRRRQAVLMRRSASRSPARSPRSPSGTETAPFTILVIQSICTVSASRPRAPGQIVSLVSPPSICACAASLPGRTGMSLVVTLR